MDASGLYFNSQKRTDNASETGSDIISNLPESILTHILSLLPTKYAVRTSVLSKQWKYTWTNVTKLHFDGSLLLSHETTKRFMNFMERVLARIENNKLESFYLSCESHCDASRVHAWVSAATRHQARRIDICYRNHDFVLPRCVFENEAVKELKLCVNCTIKVAPSFFSRLETLDLSGVTFLNTCFSDPTELTLTFPNLKVLTLCGGKWLNVKGANVDVPALNLDVPALHSFKWFPYRNDGCVIKISGQNLEKFRYGGGLAEEIVMHCPSSVVDATIQVFGNQEHKSRVIRACNLLRMFVGVENLTISSVIFRALAYKKNLQAVLPTYDNLVRLKITWQRVVVDGTFMALLRSAPVLQTLIFSEGILLYKKKAVEEMVPECFSLISR